MPDLDQFFDNAQQGEAADNYVDMSRDEMLEELQPSQPPTSNQVPTESAPESAIGGVTPANREGGYADPNPYNPNEDAAYFTLGGLELVTGQDLGLDDYVARQRAGVPNLADQLTKEPINVLAGAAIGAAESVGSAAEFVGDNAKTFTGLAQETDYVFGDKYQWSKWDLNKDNLGAKTGVGKIAQGFVEFGILLYGTGGFGAISKGSLLAQVGQGALRGMAADMIDATKGEGNLSNLIKENAPDWYPSWLTALAVDEDDTPWEAILKTTAEGAGLGAIADAIMGYVAGVRAARKAPKGTSTEQLQEIAVEAAQAKMRQLELGLPRARVEEVDRVTPVFDQLTSEFPDEVEKGLKAANNLEPYEMRSLVQDYDVLQYVDEDQFLAKAPIDLQLNIKGEAFRNRTLKNGSTINWIIKDESNLYESIVDVPTYRIDWDISTIDARNGGLGDGASGIELYNQFNDIAAELKPGSVVVAEAANDGFGIGMSGAQARAAEVPNTEAVWRLDNYDAARAAFVTRENAALRDWEVIGPSGREAYMDKLAEEGVIPAKPKAAEGPSIRERLYKRAGLSSPDVEGRMFGVVMLDKQGRRRLQPLDITGDVESQLESIRKATSEQLSLNLAKGTPLEAALEHSTATGNLDRFNRLAPLLDQQAKGIPVYYDDVANAFPEYFSIPAVGREVLPDFHPEVYKKLYGLGPDDGITINPFTGEVPTSGTMVAIDGAVLDDLSPEAVQGFIARNGDMLSRDDVYLGSWVSKVNGKPVVELSRLVRDHDEAVMLGRAFDQEGVFRLDDFEDVSTGGMDRLRHTKGGHIGPAKDIPQPRIETDDATKVVEQQMILRELDGVSSPGSTGRTITDAQLHRIANATDDQAAAVLRNLADENPIRMDELSKAVKKTDAEIAADAVRAIQDTLGTAGEVDFDKLLTQTVGDDTLLTRTGIVQVRGLMQELSTRAADRAIDLTKRLDAGEEAFLQFDRLVEDLKGLLKVHKISANTYSAQLRAYKVDIPFLGKQIEIPAFNNVKTGEAMAAELDEAAKALDEVKAGLRSGDPAVKAQAVQVATAIKLAGGDVTKTVSLAKSARALAGDDAFSIMYNSMLSSPATHAVNTLSNAMNTVYRPLAGYAGGDAKAKRQAIAGFYGFYNNVSESAALAAKVFREGASPNSGTKGYIQAGEAGVAVEQLTMLAEKSSDSGYKAAVGWMNTLHNMANNPVFNWPSKLLTTSDEFFKALVARMEFQSQAMGRAIDEAGTSGAPLEDVFKKIIDETKQYNISKSGQILNPDLLTTAKEVTFQTELDGWAKTFGDAVNHLPVLRPFFPFVKTGHNIMVYTGSHVPLLSRQLSEVKAVMNGTDEYAKAVIKGRQAVGRWLVVTGAMAAYSGFITGNGPPDPQERKLWLKTNQPRSFKIGNKFVNYDRIEPFGQILSAVADLVEMSKYATKHGLGGDQVEYLSGYLTYAIANNFTNKSYMQGVVPLGKILTPGWQGVNSLATVPIEVFNNFLPLSGARRAFNNAMTPYMQEYTGVFERMFSSMIPGAGAFLGHQAYDWLDGEPIDAPAGGINALLPIRVTERRQSVVRDALEDMEYDSSVVAKTLQGVDLKGEHKSRLAQLMGESNLEKELEKLVTQKTWIQAKDDYYARVRAGRAGDKRNEIFYTQVNDLITNARDLALQQLKVEFPELQAQITDKRILRNSQRPADQDEVRQDYEYLVNWPN